MQFSVEKFISNFIENQFPQFYKEEGTDFILFTKAYYEWMESQGNPISEARNLFDYRDIDNTLESFLIHFQQKYLYGIPFNVIANKRLLLKHILDVYRSKGSIQCYKLLFKLIYNEDVEIYLPGVDILRVSDGTWVQPQYIEVTNFENIAAFMGKTIVGINSKTVATVENVVRETFRDNSITLVYFSNLQPKGGQFDIGEKIIPQEKLGDYGFISECPTVLGSISGIEILDGGRDYQINDVLKILARDPDTGESAYGRDAYLKVTKVKSGNGEIFFDLVDGGYGFAVNSAIFVYRNDITGAGASFEVGTISEIPGIPSTVTYNTDIVADYLDKSLAAATYNFPKLASANLNSTIDASLSYATNQFGSIESLKNINVGSGYTKPANVFVRSVMLSSPLNVGLSYNTASPVITFSSTEQILTYANLALNSFAYNFPRNPTGNVASILETTISLSNFYNLFAPNDVISLQSNSSNVATRELQVIKEISGLNQIILYGPPKFSSTVSAQARVAAVIFPSNFSDTELLMSSPNQQRNGINERIRAFASYGNSIVATAVSYTGKGFVEGEKVTAGLYGILDKDVQIIAAGTGYSNDNMLIFSGGQYTRPANGFIITSNTGSIVDVVVLDSGSGYRTAPDIYVQSKSGNGAILKASVIEFNYDTLVKGLVQKSGNGKDFGYYSTTRGFLDSDKYIQDSYYYQDYSYEIRISQSLNKYKDILYETFHSAGSELFGKFSLIREEGTESEILFENNSAVLT